MGVVTAPLPAPPSHNPKFRAGVWNRIILNPSHPKSISDLRTFSGRSKFWRQVHRCHLSFPPQGHKLCSHPRNLGWIKTPNPWSAGDELQQIPSGRNSPLLVFTNTEILKQSVFYLGFFNWICQAREATATNKPDRILLAPLITIKC